MHQLPTPFLCIQQAIVQRNIQRLADYSNARGLKVRPHTKTHKSLPMASLQLAAHGAGLTVAKAGEAEVMSAGCSDLLVGYPALDRDRASLLAQLARQQTIRVAVDSRLAVDVLSASAASAGSTIGILVDLDVGYHRTGVQSPTDATALAQYLHGRRGARLDGIFIYPGQVRTPPQTQAPALGAVSELLAQTLDLWKSKGLPAEIISGGSTPTAYQSHLIPQLTEIRPGTYIYNDMSTVTGGFASLDDCAAKVIATVVSDAVPGKVVIDAGSKTLSSDPNAIRPDSGYGHVVEFPEARIVRLTEEHGEVDISRCDSRPKLGQRVSVIPNHICPCVNLQDWAILCHPDGSFAPLRIDARGRLS